MKFLRLSFVPIAFLCVFIIRMLAKAGIVIRFGEFFSPRLGHLAGNTECYLCEKEDGRQKGFDVWAHSSEPANKFLAKMIAREVKVDPTGFIRLIMLCNSMISGWERHIADSTQMDRDIFNLFEKYPAHLKFTKDEEERGEQGLRALGIPRGAKWVYLIVRDSAKHTHLPYHSYRNADIDNYMLAVEYLANKGYYVVRMGKNVAKALPFTSPKIIDFAMKHDDFMAVYLGAKCAFCISTSTGPDAIPYIFRRPIVYTDFVPVEYLFTFLKDSLAIWKHHYKEKCDDACKAKHMSGYETLHIKQRMTFAEIIESGAGKFMRADQFKEAGITLVPNTPEEILAVVREMEQAMQPYPFKEYSLPDYQAMFWSKFPKSISEFNNQPLHGELRMRIGSEFLKGYQ